MEPLLTQITDIVTTYPGNLIYHLVLAFSVAGALTAAINIWRSTGFPPARRMVIGLSLLLLIRLALFLVVAFIWGRDIPEHMILPPIDRAISLLSLTLIVWLWLFPERVPLADFAHVILALLVLIALVITLAWWIPESTKEPPPAFNGSWPDFISSIVHLVILSGGLIFLLVRRPAGWGYGLGTFLVLLAGHLAHFTLGPTTGDYPGLVRLAEMIAYPLLLALPLRFPLTSLESAEEVEALAGAPASGAGAASVQPIISLLTASNPAELCPPMARLIAQAMAADLCLIVAPPGEGDQAPVECVYDQEAGVSFSGLVLDARKIPVILSTLRLGRPVRLSSSSTSPDLAALAQALEMNQIGNLLAVPILYPLEQTAYAILLISPRSRRVWTADDQAALTEIARSMAQLLHRIESLETVQSGFAQSTHELQTVRQENESVRMERDRLVAQLETLRQQADKDRTKAVGLAALLKAQEAIPPPKSSQTLLENADSDEYQRMQGELRLALEEIARLTAALGQSPAPGTLQAQPAHLLAESPEASERFSTIAGELSRPATSVIEYATLLLNGAAGALDSRQRKFLERIKLSGERMRSLVEDLQTVIAHPEAGPSGPIDLSTVVSAASARLDALREEKGLIVREDIAPDLPRINADRATLERLLTALLVDAASAAPQYGVISVTARHHHESGQPDYILIQVSDGGKPISAAELPRLLTDLSPGDNSNRSLAAARAQAEALHGRLWVDSAAEKGNLVNLLVPVSPAELEAADKIQVPKPRRSGSNPSIQDADPDPVDKESGVPVDIPASLPSNREGER